jgi:hypothetical protein
MLRHFANRAGLRWGYGIGIGGGFLASVSKNMAKGPAANLYAALCALAETIRSGGAGERGDVFVTPGIPRFVYRLGGHMDWRRMAGKNGVYRQLGARPHDV